MTSPGQYGSHQYQSPETRALASITAESYDKDQAKTLIKLKNDVGYMAAYMRKMQKEIDQANENFIQQIQSFIADFIVLLGGGSLTTIDFGDLRYVIQAIGALLGFQTVAGIPIPINLFTAAWNFFGIYIAPTQQFADVINELIDAAIAIIIDALGEIPVFGQSIQQLAAWLIEIRDALWPLVDTVFLLIDTLSGQPGTEADDIMFGLFHQIIDMLLAAPDVLLNVLDALIDLLLETPQILLSLLNGLIAMLIDSPDILNTLLAALVDMLVQVPDILEQLLTGLIQLLIQVPNLLFELLDALITLLTASPDVLARLVTGVVNLLVNLPEELLTLLSSLIGLLIVSPEILAELTIAVADNLGELIGIDFSGFDEFLNSIVDGIAQLFNFDMSTGLDANSPLNALNLFNLVPGGSIPNLDASKITSGQFLTGLIPDLDASKIVSGIMTLARIPGLPASQIISGAFALAQIPVLDAGRIPTLDASKIVSGVLGLTQIPGLPASQIISGALALAQIPNLPASQITSGILALAQIPGLDAARIPNLDASKIVSGALALAQIPGLPASQIVSGALALAQIPNLPASQITSGILALAQIPGLDAARIPNLDASKIVSGVLGALQIPGLPASQITSGSFGTAQIPDLDAAKITTGAFGSGQIPNLDGSKITSGFVSDARVAGLVSVIQQLYNGTTILSSIGKANVPKTLDNTWIPSSVWPAAQIPILDQSKVTNLTSDLANRALQSVLNSKATAGANLVVDPGFDNPDVWAYEKGVMDTAQHLTGTTSRRMTADGTVQSIYLTASGGPGLGVPWMVRPGAVYYFEASVYPKSTNVGGGQIGVIGSGWDSTGVNSFTYILQPYLGPVPAKGQWTTYSGYITIPVGYDGFIPWCTVVNDVPVGDQFYWDRIVVKEATRVGNSPDLQAITDHVLNGLVGGAGYTGAGTGVIPDQARGGLDKIYRDVLNHTTLLQLLGSEENATDNSGVAVQLNFADYPDGNLPSIYSVTYIGAGTSRLGVTSGAGGWRTKVNDAKLLARAAYNAAVTNTDFQIIRGTLGGLPEQDGGGGAPRIGVMGRLNSPTSPTTFVWGRGYCAGFLSYKGEMGCMVNNVETVWVSNITLNWSTDIRCVFGVGTQPRRYQFYSGGSLIYDYTEVGTVSQLGAGFRYYGLTAEICTGSNGTPRVPGTLASAAISDNAPPTTVGSGAAMYRTNAALVNINPGVNTYPANFFGVMRYNSIDITGDLVNGTFTVSKAGFYLISWNVQGNGNASGSVSPCLFVNGTGVQFGMAQGGASAYGGFYNFYLNAGDVVRPGYYWSGSLATGYWKGESTGTWTHFEITLSNRSLN